MKKNYYKFPVGGVIAIFVSFVLAIMDMFFLYEAVQSVFGQSRIMSMVISFTIATIANYCALQWGKENGEKQNKKMTGSGAMWAFIGVLYAVIRAIKIINNINKPGFGILGEVFQIVVLAIFYLGTGFTIRKESRKIFDADAARYRKARKEFELYHRVLARTEKPIIKDMAALKNFNKHFESLERQKNEIERGIEKTENATAATIEGLVMKHNPVIDPTEAHKVVTDSLNEARTKFKEKNEKGVK